MIPFLEKLFNRSEDKIFKSKKFLKYVKSVSQLSHTLNDTQHKLEEAEYKLMMEHSEEIFISLKDIFSILAEKTPTISTILSKGQHIAEISKKDYSAIRVHAITENDHIVLCTDLKNCPEHYNYKGDPLLIVTVKK